MSLHVALLEPATAKIVAAVAKACAAADASLHLIGPVPFDTGATAFRQAGPADWSTLDLWIHPGWRDFREAISRERCIYIEHGADAELDSATVKANSVLVLGREDGSLPDRIREKHAGRIYQLPMPPRKRKVDLGRSTPLLLEAAAERISAPPQGIVEVVPTGPLRYGRDRRRR